MFEDVQNVSADLWTRAAGISKLNPMKKLILTINNQKRKLEKNTENKGLNKIIQNFYLSRKVMANLAAHSQGMGGGVLTNPPPSIPRELQPRTLNPSESIVISHLSPTVVP